MEPVHGGRDDQGGLGLADGDGAGRNGARPRRTGRPLKGGLDSALTGVPQWSPSTEDGTTRAATLDTDGDTKPQWSPSTEDGTTDKVAGTITHIGKPQWSPSTEDGTTRISHPTAWSTPAGRNGARPRRTGRPPTPAATSPQCSTSRNGARPRRTGRPPPDVTGGRWRGEPQWSPSTEDGTTGRQPPRSAGSVHAAMEPVHGGRDDSTFAENLAVTGLPQWSPSTEDGTTSQARR